MRGRNLVRILAAMLVAPISPAAAAEGGRPEAFCDGYRYAYLETQGNGSSAVLYACRHIQEPSSRPFGCHEVARADVSDMASGAAKAATDYAAGLAVGLGCGLAVSIAQWFVLSKATGKVKGDMSGYQFFTGNLVLRGSIDRNRGTEMKMIHEVQSGQRKAGEASKLRPGGVCKWILSKGSGKMMEGALAGYNAYVAYGSEITRLIADARAVRGSGKEEIDRYMERTARRNDEQVAVLRATYKGLSNSGTVIKTIMENVVGVPVGATGDVAMVSPATCMSDADLERLKQIMKVDAKAALRAAGNK